MEPNLLGRSMRKRIETYDYPPHYLVRRVSRAGAIRLFHKRVFVSKKLHEDRAGPEEVDDWDIRSVLLFLSHRTM